uniref:Uncharacterized protein n=1 Tax=Arundo donax TaxID=35708 RepID=A0A0A9AYP0_ARUDO
MFPRWSTAATTRNVASCSCSVMPTVFIALLVARYSSASLIPSSLRQVDWLR